MFEKIWILLKFWPFSAAAARLVTGAKIAISTSLAPLFLGFWWISPPPPPYFGVGNPFLRVLGCGLMVCCGHFRFFVLIECSRCLVIDTSFLVFKGLRGCFWRCGLSGGSPPPFLRLGNSFLRVGGCLEMEGTCILQNSCVPYPQFF